jgi:K+-sensing histidine kinase KdpD
MQHLRTIAVSVGLLVILTAILFRLEMDHAVGAPIFFFLLPTMLVTVLGGFLGALLFVCATLLTAAFFLYEPIYSFYVDDAKALGELICFSGLALIGAKCILVLREPSKLYKYHATAGPTDTRAVHSRTCDEWTE